MEEKRAAANDATESVVSSVATGQKLSRVQLAERRHKLQDWSVWLADDDKQGRSVYLPLHRIKRSELLDREANPIYQRIRGKFKDNLAPASDLYLTYKLPNEEFPVRVEVSNPEHILRAFDHFGRLEQGDFLKWDCSLLLSCRAAQWTRPKSPVRVVKTDLRGRATLTRYLSQQYLSQGISLDTLNETLTLPLPYLKRAVHSLLPSEAQADHTYLLEKKSRPELTPEEQYRQHKINIEEYTFAKYPRLKQEQERRNAHYPELAELHTCCVCKEMNAPIKCQECSNHICQSCIQEKLLDTKQSFLRVHRVFCLEFGMPNIRQQPTPKKGRLSLMLMPFGRRKGG
ncbi:unnamed protein product [Chrysoparadoxa australica]